MAVVTATTTAVVSAWFGRVEIRNFGSEPVSDGIEARFLGFSRRRVTLQIRCRSRFALCSGRASRIGMGLQKTSISWILSGLRTAFGALGEVLEWVPVPFGFVDYDIRFSFELVTVRASEVCRREFFKVSSPHAGELLHRVESRIRG